MKKTYDYRNPQTKRKEKTAAKVQLLFKEYRREADAWVSDYQIHKRIAEELNLNRVTVMRHCKALEHQPETTN